MSTPRSLALRIFTSLIMTSALTEIPAAESLAWTTLHSLPDPVGFGGMFAGVSQGKLFAGGGSRFLDKPVWNGGTKDFSDAVFVLDDPKGSWRKLPDKLPAPIAHAACTAHGEAVLSAGGMNTEGALKSVQRLSLDGNRLVVEALPDLPEPPVYAAAAVAGDMLLVTGGVTAPSSTTPSRACWALRLTGAAAWERMPDLPGEPGIVSSAGSDGTCFYVFGGMSYVPSENGKARPVPLASVWRLDPATRTWTALAHIPAPRVGAASPTWLLPHGRFLLAGGYGSVFPGAQKEHPGFEPETFVFDPEANTWADGPALPCERKVDANSPTSPGPEPMVAAPAVLWRNLLVILSGEVRPATRTPAVVALPLPEAP